MADEARGYAPILLGGKKTHLGWARHRIAEVPPGDHKTGAQRRGVCTTAGSMKLFLLCQTTAAIRQHLFTRRKKKPSRAFLHTERTGSERDIVVKIPKPATLRCRLWLRRGLRLRGSRAAARGGSRLRRRLVIVITTTTTTFTGTFAGTEHLHLVGANFRGVAVSYTHLTLPTILRV